MLTTEPQVLEQPTTAVECLVNIELHGHYSISGDGSIHLLATGTVHDYLNEIGLATAEVGNTVGWYAGIADLPSTSPVHEQPTHLERRRPRVHSTIWMRPTAHGGALTRLGRVSEVM